ncbi:glycosyltransferase family 2 protein [Paludibacterium yongneupense]|uniref:glycosyltransferase family 2 protein n=1 Tax=Paludibacterium yongneupense TaxID=400061 RepID=UPI00048B7F26|nr:glycosyltransferase family 2 protein [Paludibacterium yongneupense]
MNAMQCRHLVLIPSYNPGPRVYATVADARRHWNAVWVVIDGSDDGSREGLQAMAAEDPGLTVLVLPANRGKGAAVLAGMEAAARAGFTHILTMDADGQHPAAAIPAFIAASRAAPDAMILGRPLFDASAPRLRVNGRKISNTLARIETLWADIDDSLFGFRVYPVAALLAIMQKRRWMRRFDFDPEAVVRLSWAGVAAINLPAAVSYFRPEQGGVSHFRYGRDNLLLTGMHLRLLAGFLLRLPRLLWGRVTTSPPSG